MDSDHGHLFLNGADEATWRQCLGQMLLKTLRGSIFAADKNGIIRFSTPRVQNSLGLLPGSDLKDILPELWREVRAFIPKPELGNEGLLLNSQFSILNSQFHISPLRYKDECIGILCIAEDIDDRLTCEIEALRDLNRELDSIIYFSHDGLWICDAEGTVIRINKSSERMHHISASEIVGRNMRELVAEGFIDRSAAIEVLKTKAFVNILQQTKDGRKFGAAGHPIFDKNGHLTRVIVNEWDITEVDALHQKLQEQEATKDKFRRHLLEIQIAELKSRKIIAKSPDMIKVLRQAMKASAVDASVLILGESGTGKGIIADLIHKYSARSEHPMIKINCGAIPESLVESELFGYETGAFTGALKKGKPGYFELANGGILFLDEIAELPPASQVKLLRFLEDGQIRRLGGTASHTLDVRILAATNRNLEEMVEQGEFRLDLYYRLHVIPIRVPSLRDRKECILPLLHHYIEHFSKKLGRKDSLGFTRKASDILLSYAYPGNVRELMNLCERLAVMSEGTRIDTEDLPGSIVPSENRSPLHSDIWKEKNNLREILDRVECKVIREAMETYGSQSKAAEVLGVNQSTIARKLKRYKLI